MNFDEKIFAEFSKLNQKIDRLNSIVMQLPTTHNTDLGKWLTEEQARELLQRGATSLWDLRKSKKIIWSKIGNRIYYDRQSILRFIEKSKTK